jgi:hypothetical protein
VENRAALEIVRVSTAETEKELLADGKLPAARLKALPAIVISRELEDSAQSTWRVTSVETATPTLPLPEHWISSVN